MNVRRAQTRALGLISRGSVVTRPVGLVALLLTAVGTVAAGPDRAALAAEVDVSRATIEVSVQQDLLTLTTVDAPLGEVLEAIAKQAEFRLDSRGALDMPVTWSFADVPVEEGVQRLLHDISSVIIYGPTLGARKRPREVAAQMAPPIAPIARLARRP